MPGLTPDVATFLLTHQSSVYDFQALLRFGAALQASGGDPSTVYSKVLSTSADTAQQAEALRQLLAYWQTEEEGCYSGGCGDGDDAAGMQEEAVVVARLARLLETQEAAAAGSPAGGAAHFVDVLLAAQLPESLVTRLCEHLLEAADGRGGACRCCCCKSSSAATGGSLGPASSSSQAAAGATTQTCGSVQLLYRYVRLRAKEQQKRAAVKPGPPGMASGVGGAAHHPHARARRIEQVALGGLFAVLTVFERRGGGMARLLKAASLLALVFRRDQPSAVPE